MPFNSKNTKALVKKIVAKTPTIEKKIEVEFNENTRNSIVSLMQQRDSINSQIESTLLVYLDAKGIDARNKVVDFSEDFTKIIVTQK